MDEIDLEHIKLIHDLTNQTNKVIANVHTDRYFYGNVNQKLFVKCTIKNPLSIEIQVSSVKLYCQFIPQKNTSTQTPTPTPTPTPMPNNTTPKPPENTEQTPEPETQQHLSYTISEDSYNMKPGETIELELNVSSPKEGKIIVKGLEFILFNECKIIHLFSKKTTQSLYYYVNRKKMYSMGGAAHFSSSGSSSDYESRNSSELVAKNTNLNNIVIPRKNKIEYIISDFKDDLFVTFPLGTNVNVFLYQLFFFPIIVNNNSIQQRVRRYTIFIEVCDKNKARTFFNFITRDNQIKQRFSSEKVLIPIIPMATGKIYIKILIKCSGEMRVKPIQVKRYLLKLKVKESISFEVREYCSNLNVDKDGKTYNKIDFNIKTNLRIRNAKEIKNLVMKEPVFNKELNLLNQKNYLITNNEIHKKFVFIKENISNSNNDIKYNLDFITNNINKENTENKENKENKENENIINDNDNTNPINNITINRTSNNNFIVDRFNKILNKQKWKYYFLPKGGY